MGLNSTLMATDVLDTCVLTSLLFS
jgi:hypothetical protein